MFYYADEFTLSWIPTLQRLWSPVGQQVMIRMAPRDRHCYGLGAVNYHTGETLVLFRARKRRLEVAQLLQALLDKHPTGNIYLVWDNASTHRGGEINAILAQAQGRLRLLYLPTYSPWLNPIEMVWRHCRRWVTHCELFPSLPALIEAAQAFFSHFNLHRHLMCSIIGSHSA